MDLLNILLWLYVQVLCNLFKGKQIDNLKALLKPTCILSIYMYHGSMVNMSIIRLSWLLDFFV